MQIRNKIFLIRYGLLAVIFVNFLHNNEEILFSKAMKQTTIFRNCNIRL